jgi:hypothetical protein
VPHASLFQYSAHLTSATRVEAAGRPPPARGIISICHLVSPFVSGIPMWPRHDRASLSGILMSMHQGVEVSKRQSTRRLHTTKP